MRENQLSACVLVMHNHQLDEQRANTRLNTIYLMIINYAVVYDH